MSQLTQKNKWVVSVYAALVFLLISNPLMYKLTDALTRMLSPSFRMANSSGCPTTLGFVVHTIVFILVVRLLMAIPLFDKQKDKGYQ